MNVWSPWGEPWWWRLMYFALAFVCALGLFADRQALRERTLRP